MDNFLACQKFDNYLFGRLGKMIEPVISFTRINSILVLMIYNPLIYLIHLGCRTAGINLEARSLNNWSTSRHCVLVKILDLSVEQYHNIRNKAGGLVVILPDDMTNLTANEQQVRIIINSIKVIINLIDKNFLRKFFVLLNQIQIYFQHILLLENQMLSHEVTIPIYFMNSNSEVNSIINDLKLAANNNATNSVDDLSKSATEALFASVAANGYQIVVSSSSSASLMTDVKVATIHGHLSGYNPNGKLLTIAIVAHYDSFAVAPVLFQFTYCYT